jgi:poly(3-hydroxybutyrate) depolymerase
MRASGYYCAEDDLFKAVNCSLKTSKKYLANLEKITTSWAGKGLIDPLQNLRNEPIYLWSGRRDATVHQAAVNALRSYYGDFGADVFQYDNQFAAGHGWESPHGPAQCNLTQSPFINLCYDSSHRVYDSEQVWLSRFLGNLQPKNEATLNGAVLPLNQNEFAPPAAALPE